MEGFGECGILRVQVDFTSLYGPILFLGIGVIWRWVLVMIVGFVVVQQSVVFVLLGDIWFRDVNALWGRCLHCVGGLHFCRFVIVVNNYLFILQVINKIKWTFFYSIFKTKFTQNNIKLKWFLIKNTLLTNNKWFPIIYSLFLYFFTKERTEKN